MEINEDQLSEKKQRLFMKNLIIARESVTCILAETQKQTQEWNNLILAL